MKYDNKNTKKLVEECYTELDTIMDILRDINNVSEFIEADFLFELTSTKGQLRTVKENLGIGYKYLTQKINLPLVALESYTNGKVSWERAGEISGLGSWGLKEYCNQRDVDTSKLRIDKYMNFTGDEAETEICKQWDMLMDYEKKNKKF